MTRILSKYCFFLLLLGLFPLMASAQETDLSLRRDSSQVEHRTFDQDLRDGFLADEDFLYDRPADTRIKRNLFQRFLRLLRYWWDTLFDEDTPAWVPVLVLLSLLLGLVATFFWVMGVPLGSILGKREKKIVVDYEELKENIHELDFEQLVREAAGQGHYRRAVRLLYLESLKLLSDKEWIDWQINKTNHDYQYELVDTPVATPFEELTLHFEYVWYGDFAIDKRQYQIVERIFRDFQAKLTRKR
jgi:hypothetical protein